MTNEKIAQDSYRKFAYFFENKISVHFKDFDDIFYNGEIISLDENYHVMVLKERLRGTIPILLEFVNPDSICKMEESGA